MFGWFKYFLTFLKRNTLTASEAPQKAELSSAAAVFTAPDPLNLNQLIGPCALQIAIALEKDAAQTLVPPLTHDLQERLACFLSTSLQLSRIEICDLDGVRHRLERTCSLRSVFDRDECWLWGRSGISGRLLEIWCNNVQDILRHLQAIKPSHLLNVYVHVQRNAFMFETYISVVTVHDAIRTSGGEKCTTIPLPSAPGTISTM